MRRWRVVFMGTPEFAVPSLEQIAREATTYELVGVVTQPDRPAGRGQRVVASPVKAASMRLGVPVLQPTKMKAPQTHDAIAGWAPDVVVVAAYGRILPPHLLAIAPYGCINVHASLLPRHRGASPIAHAILCGDAETGVSIMKMDEGCDTGPVYARQSLAIAANDTTGTLGEKLAQLGAALLGETLPHILRGEVGPEAQQAELASVAPLLSKEDGGLDLRQSAVALERRVRAFDPWPGAYLTLGELRVAVVRACTESQCDAPVGSVLAADRNGVLVACGEGALRLLDVKPAGRKQMSAAAWVQGRGVRVGDAFDLPA